MTEMSPLVLDDILNYIPKYKNETFVIFISGSVIEKTNLHHLCRQIAILHSLSIQIIIVHGARQQISQVIKQSEIYTIHNENIRVTTPEILRIATEKSLDISYKIFKSLVNNHLTGLTIDPILGHFIKAKPMGIINGIDFLHTGQVDKIRKKKILNVLNQNSIPIIPPLGLDSEGNHYNLRGVEIAAQISTSVNAKKLIFCITDDYKWISDKMGVMELDDLQEKIQKLRDKNELDEILSERLNAALLACQKGVERIHFINGLDKESILQEIFTKAGHGLLITGEKYNNIRKANMMDAQRIYEIFSISQGLGELKNRTLNDLSSQISDYFVFEIDSKICAVVALHLFGQECAELAGLAVDPHYRHLGIGKKMVSFLMQRMVKLKIQNLYALTTRASQFFKQMGFNEIPKNDAPDRIQKNWDQNRNSKIFLYKNSI